MLLKSTFGFISIVFAKPYASLLLSITVPTIIPAGNISPKPVVVTLEPILISSDIPSTI